MREVLLQIKNRVGGKKYVPGAGKIGRLLRCLLTVSSEEETPVITEDCETGLWQTAV